MKVFTVSPKLKLLFQCKEFNFGSKRDNQHNKNCLDHVELKYKGKKNRIRKYKCCRKGSFKQKTALETVGTTLFLNQCYRQGCCTNITLDL